MESQTQLAEGITAAKNGERHRARNILYDILDREPKNEAAWIWLSYVVDTVEDRQICLENVLFINPNNDYAQRGVKQLIEIGVIQKNGLKKTGTVQKPQPISTLINTFVIITVAFWCGIGGLFLVFGVFDIISWGIDISNSRAFPRYITTYQLMTLTLAIIFFVFGLLSLNLAWSLHKRNRSAFYVSLILSLGVGLAGPLSSMIIENPNYLLVSLMAALPITIFILTLISQPAFAYE